MLFSIRIIFEILHNDKRSQVHGMHLLIQRLRLRRMKPSWLWEIQKSALGRMKPNPVEPESLKRSECLVEL